MFRRTVNWGITYRHIHDKAMYEPCEKTYCAWGATCVVSENGKALCQCPTNCPSNSAPVCGSDDVTYTNQCHLRQASCQRRKNTRIKHEGACDPGIIGSKGIQYKGIAGELRFKISKTIRYIKYHCLTLEKTNRVHRIKL
ncbi:hypothetical protein M0802_002594 [Mischocyttarus mexicanus]|nr:hypothetical protein M0802_002594 [Mischocyttarus mexicanus]